LRIPLTIAQHSACYMTAGAVGGLLVTLAFWALGKLGVPYLLGVSSPPPALELPTIYRNVVWGGLWALLFLLPVSPGSLWRKAMVLTLVPVLFALLVFLPMRGGSLFGLDRGYLTPIWVYVVNLAWGFTTAYLGSALIRPEGEG
jgi:hypothetical protein